MGTEKNPKNKYILYPMVPESKEVGKTPQEHILKGHGVKSKDLPMTKLK